MDDPLSNPMPSRPTSVAISRTCSTFRDEDGARVLVFTDKEQDTPEVMEVDGGDHHKRYGHDGNKLCLLGESSDGGTSFQGTFDHPDSNRYSPRLRERSRVLMAPAHWLLRAAGTMSWSRPRPATRFPEAGKALRLWTAAEKEDYLLFGVWLDETADGADTFGAIATGGQPFT